MAYRKTQRSKSSAKKSSTRSNRKPASNPMMHGGKNYKGVELK